MVVIRYSCTQNKTFHLNLITIKTALWILERLLKGICTFIIKYNLLNCFCAEPSTKGNGS